ncbi:MAG: hypothetical protein ACK44N_04955, partial [Bacteroidota bacterium]
MSLRKIFIQISNKHDLYYRIVLISVSILLITYFLPQQVKFKYDFYTGEIWHYEDLRAPFDFPIYKSEKQMDADRKQIIQHSSLYFVKDTAAYLHAIEEFHT